jgi:hypothetical protein
MTAESRAISMIGALTDKNITSVKAMRIASGYLLTKRIDTTSMTNEDIFNAFLNNLKAMLQNHVVSSAVTVAQKNNRAVENAAANNALNDFN